MTEKLRTLEKDLVKILDANWMPGAARMVYVHSTRAWTGDYKSWNAWIMHLVRTTSNTKTWLYRVFKAGELLLQVAEKHYPNIEKADRTSVKSIESVLFHFEKAKPAALYMARRLAERSGNDDYIHQAALGEITQPDILDLLAQYQGSVEGDRSGDEGGEGGEENLESQGDNQRSASAPADVARTGSVTFSALKRVAEKHGIDSAVLYAALLELRVSVKNDA